MADEFVVDFFVCFEECGAATVWYGPDVNGIAVVMVQQEDVIVAGAGGDNKAACKVRECFAGASVPDGSVA